jgi:hypothetical protein
MGRAAAGYGKTFERGRVVQTSSLAPWPGWLSWDRDRGALGVLAVEMGSRWCVPIPRSHHITPPWDQTYPGAHSPTIDRCNLRQPGQPGQQPGHLSETGSQAGFRDLSFFATANRVRCSCCDSSSEGRVHDSDRRDGDGARAVGGMHGTRTC